MLRGRLMLGDVFSGGEINASYEGENAIIQVLYGIPIYFIH
jgi:hypothetical protein